MLSRVLKKNPSFVNCRRASTSHGPASDQFPTSPQPNLGRRLDITFHPRYLKAARQLPVMATIWRIKQRKNIEKAAYRRLPAEEKHQLYLTSRPMKRKLLDWVGSKSQALVRAARTVDAWSGPPSKVVPARAQLGPQAEMKLLGSGGVGYIQGGMSERAKRVMVVGMIVSLGGLMGWLAFGFMERTKAEGATVTDETVSGRKTSAFLDENVEKKPGVFIWGSNRGDVTAPGSKDDFVKTATRLPYFDNRGLRDLALSNDLGVAVDEQGNVIQWGRAFSHTFYPETTLKHKNISQVAISGDNVICLSKSGSIYILPASKQSLLSGPKPTESSWIPFWTEPSNVSYEKLALHEPVANIASGDDHFLLLTRSGKVLSAATTGDGNTFGQLGVDTSPDSALLTPYPVHISIDPISSIAAGERHSVALTSRGEVYSWGSNAQGQLMQEFSRDSFTTTTPTLVPLQKLIPGIRSVKAIAAGGANSYLVADVEGDLEMYSSGSGMWGQLGSGLWNQIQHRPVRVKVIQGLVEWSEKLGKKVNIGVKYMSVGENHAAAVLDNDVSGGVGGRDVFIWGCGEAYQLGHGKRNNLNVPSSHNALVNAKGRLAEMSAEKFMLKPKRKVEIVTSDGGKRKVECEETIVFGGGCSAVYEKIIS